jgi:hypothetical protein
MKNYFLLSILFLFSCTNESPSKQETPVEINESVNKQEITFEIIDVHLEGIVEVFVVIDGERYRIESVTGMGMSTIEKETYSDYDIPSDAIDAIAGFWAGFQTIFYIKDLGEEVVVMKAERDEFDLPPLNYKEVLKIRK